MPLKISAIVLAAGFSNRFGSIKLCAQLPNGKTVFQQTLENLGQAVQDILVVTREEVLPLIARDEIDIQVFSNPELGMGASLAFGVRKMQQQGSCDGCLVCLADMPFIKPSSYLQISEALRPGNIVIPHYQGKPGNPAGFGKQFFTSLAALTGDQGGRRVVSENRQAVLKLAIDDPGLLNDIDTPADLSQQQQ